MGLFDVFDMSTSGSGSGSNDVTFDDLDTWDDDEQDDLLPEHTVACPNCGTSHTFYFREGILPQYAYAKPNPKTGAVIAEKQLRTVETDRIRSFNCTDKVKCGCDGDWHGDDVEDLWVIVAGKPEGEIVD